MDTARGLGLQDHVCWSYDEDCEFRRRAREFLVEGLALGQQVWYVGDGSPEALADDLSANRDMGRALRAGAACVAPVDDALGPDAVIEPEARVASYASATERALDDGFTGLRVAADVTTVVRKPSQLDAFARYEHLIDRYMTARPFAALCGYDRRELGDRAVAEVACMHPNTTRNAAPFRLYASSDPGCSGELSGEVDLASVDLFPLALRRAEPAVVAGDRVVLDGSRLTFIDHRGLVALDDHARERGVPVVLRTGLSTPARVIEALNLENVWAERAA
ncbi:MEDS domain-containing protein [Kutzneria sp. NPDC052558]|uniref:MEDS domain-containing protein n=1 Tax=Kutzneria sp. NPDC052558 TaxID=3364121 RepID=UPI0037C8AF7C